MYDQPASLKKDDYDLIGEKKQEFKFEWQKNAPREKYLKDDTSVQSDQPFGIAVKNVRCLKCKQWGHMNTDKECALYGQSTSLAPTTFKVGIFYSHIFSTEFRKKATVVSLNLELFSSKKVLLLELTSLSSLLAHRILRRSPKKKTLLAINLRNSEKAFFHTNFF